MLSLGNALLRAGDPAGAIAQFQEGIRQVPDRPEHYVSLGVAYLSQGRTREGIEQLKAALTREGIAPESSHCIKSKLCGH